MDPLILSNAINSFQDTQINLSVSTISLHDLHSNECINATLYELLIQQLEQLYQDNPNDKISSPFYPRNIEISLQNFLFQIHRQNWKRNI